MLFILGFFSSNVFAGEITLRQIPNSKEEEGTIHQILKASHDELWKTLNDVENYGQYMPKMQKVKILSVDANHIVYHATINMPWPISDVEYDCDVTPAKDKSKIEFHMVDGTGRNVKTFYGHWAFKPISNTETDATYVLVFDSGKHYPQWAENIGLRSTLGNVMKSVQSRIDYLRSEKKL